MKIKLEKILKESILPAVGIGIMTSIYSCQDELKPDYHYLQGIPAMMQDTTGNGEPDYIKDLRINRNEKEYSVEIIKRKPTEQEMNFWYGMGQ